MKPTIFAILAILLLTNCNNSKKKTVDKNEPVDSVSEPGKPNELSQATCIFLNPDTSVAGIKISNVESTLSILGKQTELEGDSTHIFYSADKKQKLGLTVHPGDFFSQVSIFKISYSDNSNQKARQINTKEFETEKGIKLGISKSEIIERLGTCYTAKDSTNNSIELVYRLEHPNDSKTKILTSHNMPSYYASYRLTNDKLEYFEFGFAYP